jgi:hypothetical protein
MSPQRFILTGENNEKQWQNVYLCGGIAALMALIGILLDVIAGSILGGNLTELPQTAVERFVQLQQNPALGLYNLDLLNSITQLILIPAYFALFAAHRKVQSAYAGLALVTFLVGTTLMVANNTALGMLELSNKYAAAITDSQRTLLAAAGEAMLGRGAHGSPGMLIGFLLPNIAGIIMSFAMLSGGLFSRLASYLGLIGSSLMVLYLSLVTFIPGVKTIATAFAMPGGLLLMAWMIIFAIRLLQLGRPENYRIVAQGSAE